MIWCIVSACIPKGLGTCFHLSYQLLLLKQDYLINYLPLKIQVPIKLVDSNMPLTR